MITAFLTLQALLEYIPNCIVCTKPMNLQMSGTLAYQSGSHNRERYSMTLALKDNLLVSKHKSHKLIINPIDNTVIESVDLAGRIISEYTSVKKMCPTCHFKIETFYSGNKAKKEKTFPALMLQNEELHFIMKGGKDVRVTKYYSGNNNDREATARIQLNGKYLPPMPFDFDKFNSFQALNKRINTIVVFH